MRIRDALKNAAILIIIYIAIIGIIVGSAWFGCWQYVLQHQWITLPTTHYEWWQFIFAWDQAWPWLWYVNFPLWFINTFTFAVIISAIISLIIMAWAKH